MFSQAVEAVLWAADEAVTAAVSVGFARYVLRGRAEASQSAVCHGVMLGLMAWVSTKAVLRRGEGVFLFKNYASLWVCAVLSYGSGRCLGKVRTAALAAVVAAVASTGRGGLGLRLLAAWGAYALSLEARVPSKLAVAGAAVAAAAAPGLAAAILPVDDFSEAYAALARLCGDADVLRRRTLVLVVTGLHAQLAVGECGVEYLRASQRRKNALLQVVVGGGKPGPPPLRGGGGGGGGGCGAARFARREALAFVLLAAVPYLVERTSVEALYEVAYRRYVGALQRGLRLEAVLGAPRAATGSALEALEENGGQTVESYGRSVEAVSRQMYQLASRKVFSLPKLALVPRIVAAHPGAAAVALPFFLLVDSVKARVVAALSRAIEHKRKLATELASRRSRVEAHDVSRAGPIAFTQASAWNARQWGDLATAMDRIDAARTLLETLRRYVRWLYWSDFLTPSIEVAMAYLLERGLIGFDDLWVTARAFEDAIDLALTKSRADSELAELETDVGRLNGLADALDTRRSHTTPAMCRRGSTSSNDETTRIINLALDGVAFSRGGTTVRADGVSAGPGEVLAITGPNGSGKSSFFALVDACANGRPAPASLTTHDGAVCNTPAPHGNGDAATAASSSADADDDDPRQLMTTCAAAPVLATSASLVHVSQRPYCPVHTRPIDWVRFTHDATTKPAPQRRRTEAEDLASLGPILDGLHFEAGDAPFNTSTLLAEHDDFCGTLSGGQMVKLELTRQILLPVARDKTARCAPLILLDEVFSPLDPRSKATVQRALRRACPDSTVLAIYHSDAACVPDAGFFTGTLHFHTAEDGSFHIQKRPTCPPRRTTTPTTTSPSNDHRNQDPGSPAV